MRSTVPGNCSGVSGPAELRARGRSLVLFVFLAALWGRAGRVRFGASLSDNDVLDGVLFISPNFLGFLGFLAGPLLFSLYVSLTSWNAFSDQSSWACRLRRHSVVPSAHAGRPSVFLAPGLQAGYSEIARIGSLVIAAEDKLF